MHECFSKHSRIATQQQELNKTKTQRKKVRIERWIYGKYYRRHLENTSRRPNYSSGLPYDKEPAQTRLTAYYNATHRMPNHDSQAALPWLTACPAMTHSLPYHDSQTALTWLTACPAMTHSQHYRDLQPALLDDNGRRRTVGGSAARVYPRRGDEAQRIHA